ncbi:hypothetical protein CG006_02370 [Mesoplasma florum]|uniref:hypothetical protein n=1 Tax=Mesoplasma florum TaxID=2151 RepID=UPI000D044860|nr:hypothetical protein [Mesoplasma florum]AVN63812.1 hypothetical protein CG006_02370 [Mesoplasma florum]
MKTLIYALTGLTVTQGGTGILNLVDISTKPDGESQNQNLGFIEYDYMDRAALTFSTSIDQSFFDQKSGYTTWIGKEKDGYNYLYRTKMKSDFTGPTQEAAMVPKKPGSQRTKKQEVSGQTIFYADDNSTYYFSESGVFKFEWKQQYSTYGLIGGIGGILGGVGGILGGVGGILGGVLGLLVPTPPKQEPVNGVETKPITVSNETVNDAVYNPVDNSITISTLLTDSNEWRIVKYYQGNSGIINSKVLATGESNTNQHPILSVESNSKDTYFVVNGSVSVYRDNKNAIEFITELPNKDKQPYKVIVDSKGMYIGVSSSSDTSAKGHSEALIKNSNPETYYIDRINNTIEKDIKGDGYIREVQIVNDITKYVIYDSKTIVNSNSFSGSKYEIDGTKINPNLTVSTEENRRYSGMFDYGVMYQAKEKYKYKQGDKEKTGTAVINRTYNDKFQETVRSSNLIGVNPLEWTIGANGEVFIWEDNKKLTLSANSFISKVLLTEENSEKPVENGVQYDKTDEKNQFWVIKIPEQNADKGYDLYVQFFDEEKQPNNVITSVIRLRPTKNSKIDLSKPENFIEEKIKNISNDIKTSEILAALSEVTGININEKDVDINIVQATFKEKGKVIINAKNDSKLVREGQTFDIPHLVYDLSKTIFDPFDKDTKQNYFSEAEYKDKIIDKIVQHALETSSGLDKAIVENETNITITLPQSGENGKAVIKAKTDAQYVKNSQEIIIPALDAISLASLSFENEELNNNNEASDKQKIIEILINLIKTQINDNAPKISDGDIDIKLTKPSRVGEIGYLTVKATPVSKVLSDSNNIKIKAEKFDLKNFVLKNPSNMITENEINDILNLVPGLGDISKIDFEFKLEKSFVNQTGKITITANELSKYLTGEILIVIPRIRNLAEENLFKYNENNSSKDYIFYNNTSNDEIVDFLNKEKKWEEITEDDINFKVTKSATASQEGEAIIYSNNLDKVGSTSSVQDENNVEQGITVKVRFPRTELTQIFNDKVDVGQIKIEEVNEPTIEEMLMKINEQIKSKLKDQYDDVEFDDIKIQMIDRYNFEISAKEYSEVYSGSVSGSYYLTYSLKHYESNFTDGIYVDEKYKGKNPLIIDELKESYWNIGLYWNEVEITIDDESYATIKGKDVGDSNKSLYVDSIKVKITYTRDINDLILTSEIVLPEKDITKEKVINEIKNVNLNSSIEWENIEISVSDDFKDISVKAKENSIYTGRVAVDLYLTKDLNDVISLSKIEISKENFNIDGIVENIKSNNQNIQWEYVNILVQIQGEEAIIKIDSKDLKIYTGEFKATLKMKSDLKPNENTNKSTKILLWILAAINIVIIAIAAVFVKNKKKDEE